MLFIGASIGEYRFDSFSLGICQVGVVCTLHSFGRSSRAILSAQKTLTEAFLLMLLLSLASARQTVYQSLISFPDYPMATPSDRSDSASSADPLVVARDPQTPAKALERLASSSNEDVREAVAQNPSTPLRVLLELAEDLTEAFVQNPKVRAKEGPDFIERLVTEVASTYEAMPVRTGVFTKSVVPLRWLEWGSQNSFPQVRRAVAQNPETPARLLRRLAEDSAPGVRYSVAQHP
jgi:hypothetical protein